MTVVLSVLLALIALIGAWAGLQQMMIARLKLNHELFDRRFAVYLATRDYINKMLKSEGGEQEDAVAWWAVACGAPFLFDKLVADHIKEIGDRGSRIRARVGHKPIYEDPEYVGEYNENYTWLMASFDGLEERFQGSLNLFRLTPLPTGVGNIFRISCAPRQLRVTKQKPGDDARKVGATDGPI